MRRLWDSWEDDAEIRDAATGRFIDRDKLHYIDFAGDCFSVKGPSITPRPPQGQPVVAALGHGAVPYRLIARAADVGYVTPRDAGHAREIVAEIRAAQAAPVARRPDARLRRPGGVPRPRRVAAAADRKAPARRARGLGVHAATRPSSPARPRSWPTCCTEWQRAGLSGFRLRPGAIPDDLEAITRELVPELQRRGAFRDGLRGRHPARAARPQPPRQPLRQRWEATDHDHPAKQIHLAAHFPGVNNTTVWSDPRSGSHIEFSSFAHLARTAERAKFDFLFLAEGLRLREQNGQIYDLDVVGRPDTFTVLAALAAVTDRLGLAGTINSTFNEPYEVARQFASLDHLSGGRAAWNVVTSWDAFTGENFRRGGFLPQEARYERARTFLQTTWELFDSWHGDEIIADKESGVFLADAEAGPVRASRTPTSTSAGSSTCRAARRDGRSSSRPAIPRRAVSSPPPAPTRSSAGTARWRTARRSTPTSRAAWPGTGATPDQLLILPAATFVLGDTDAEARGAGPRGAPSSRSAGRRRSRSLSSCGTGTCPATTRTARCPTSIRTRASTPSPAAGPACGCTGTRWPSRRSGGPRRRRRTCPSAS